MFFNIAICLGKRHVAPIYAEKLQPKTFEKDIWQLRSRLLLAQKVMRGDPSSPTTLAIPLVLKSACAAGTWRCFRKSTQAPTAPPHWHLHHFDPVCRKLLVEFKQSVVEGPLVGALRLGGLCHRGQPHSAKRENSESRPRLRHCCCDDVGWEITLILKPSPSPFFISSLHVCKMKHLSNELR